MRFQDLSLGIKQRIGFGLILLVLAGVAVYSIRQLAVLRDEIDAVNDIWLERVHVISELNLNASAFRIAQLQGVYANSLSQWKALRDSADASVGAIQADVEAYDNLRRLAQERGLDSDTEQALLDAFNAFEVRWERYAEQSMEIIDLVDANERDVALEVLTGDAALSYSDFSGNLELLVDLTKEGAAEGARRSRTTFRTTRNRIVVLLLVAIALSAMIATVLVQLITTPVNRLVMAARKVADGDLAVTLPVTSADELGRLSRTFNWMTKSLGESIEKTRKQAAELQDKTVSLESQKIEIVRKNVDLSAALDRVRETQEQLIMNEKMASLGELTAGIAHEIKNPLNFVNNFAQLSEELIEEIHQLEARRANGVNKEIDEQIGELIGDLKFNAKKIGEHGKRADGIVRAMLQHSRGSSSERMETAVNPLVDEYVNLAYHGMRAHRADFNATIDRAYDEAVGSIDLVPQDIGRVLINLINNAFYAVYERALTSDGAYDPRVGVATKRINDHLIQIAVTDNGGGVPEEILDRIFEPFFTTKPTGSGTGLGLSLSYEIVTKVHGGNLEVDSIQGEGSVFTVTLPG